MKLLDPTSSYDAQRNVTELIVPLVKAIAAVIDVIQAPVAEFVASFVVEEAAARVVPLNISIALLLDRLLVEVSVRFRCHLDDHCGCNVSDSLLL